MRTTEIPKSKLNKKITDLFPYMTRKLRILLAELHSGKYNTNQQIESSFGYFTLIMTK